MGRWGGEMIGSGQALVFIRDFVALFSPLAKGGLGAYREGLLSKLAPSPAGRGLG